MHDAEICFCCRKHDLRECHRNNLNAKLERGDSVSPTTYGSTSNLDLPMLSRSNTVVFDQWQQV